MFGILTPERRPSAYVLSILAAILKPPILAHCSISHPTRVGIEAYGCSSTTCQQPWATSQEIDVPLKERKCGLAPGIECLIARLLIKLNEACNIGKYLDIRRLRTTFLTQDNDLDIENLLNSQVAESLGLAYSYDDDFLLFDIGEEFLHFAPRLVQRGSDKPPASQEVLMRAAVELAVE
jgi:hypothetical protein